MFTALSYSSKSFINPAFAESEVYFVSIKMNKPFLDVEDAQKYHRQNQRENTTTAIRHDLSCDGGDGRRCLDIEDVEQAVLNERIVKAERDDPRGTKYVVEGTSVDGMTPVAVVGRFTNSGRYLIITVYEVNGA